MAYAQPFIITDPTDVSAANLLGADIRLGVKTAIKERLDSIFGTSGASSFDTADPYIPKNFSIGSAIDTTRGLNILPTVLTGLAQYGAVIQPTGTAAGTTSLDGTYTRIITAAAAYTVASGYGLRVDSASLGAGSAITINYGIYVENQTVGVTNYALYTKAGLVHFGDNVDITGSLAITSNFQINVNKFVVAGASGNTLIAGTLGVTGAITGTLTGSISGNAATATILQNTRTINGINFNGSANINIPSPAASVTSGTFGAGGYIFPSTLEVTGDFTVNLNKFQVVAASGNTVAAGILTGLLGVTSGADITAVGAFGCNGKAAQASYAAGAALAAYGAGANGFSSGAMAAALYAMVVSLRAALFANGIVS